MIFKYKKFFKNNIRIIKKMHWINNVIEVKDIISGLNKSLKNYLMNFIKVKKLLKRINLLILQKPQ